MITNIFIELEKSVAKCTETENEKHRLEEELENVQTQYSEKQRELMETKLNMEELVYKVDTLKNELQASNDALTELQQKQELEKLRSLHQQQKAEPVESELTAGTDTVVEVTESTPK